MDLLLYVPIKLRFLYGGWSNGQFMAPFYKTITFSERYHITSFDLLIPSPVISQSSLEPLIAYLASAHFDSTTVIDSITIYLINDESLVTSYCHPQRSL